MPSGAVPFCRPNSRLGPRLVRVGGIDGIRVSPELDRQGAQFSAPFFAVRPSLS
jgi:hypothetical protein